MQGRQRASAPLLRRKEVDGRQGGHPAISELLPAFSNEVEAQVHEIDRLPHMHSKEEIERMFPTIVAAPACENSDDWDPDCVDELPQIGHGLSCVEDVPQTSRLDWKKVRSSSVVAGTSACTASRVGAKNMSQSNANAK